MSYSLSTFLPTLALLLLSSPSSSAPRVGYPVDFSADVVDYVPPYAAAKAHLVARIFVSKGRFRSDSEDGGSVTAFLADPSSGHSWLLMPEGKLALDVSDQTESARHAFGVSASAQPTDPINLQAPCAEFKGISCNEVGTEMVNGRSTQKWEFTQMFGTHVSKSHQWIDPKLLIAIKLEDRRSGRQLLNIKEGPQPEALFHVPAGYQQH